MKALSFALVCMLWAGCAMGQGIINSMMTIATLNEPAEPQTPSLVGEKQYDVVGIKEAKVFRITDDGGYEYYDGKEVVITEDLKDYESLKEGYKPITERTFFLEARRRQLLPDSLTYRQFTAMTLEEKRKALQNDPGWELILAERSLTMRKKSVAELMAEQQELLPPVESTLPGLIDNSADLMTAGYLVPDSAFLPEDSVVEGICTMRDLITHQRDKYKYAFNSANKIKLKYDEAGARLVNHHKVNQNIAVRKTEMAEVLEQ